MVHGLILIGVILMFGIMALFSDRETIKEKGRTYVKNEKRNSYAYPCDMCERICPILKSKDCGVRFYWTETFLSKLKDLIKRMMHK